MNKEYLKKLYILKSYLSRNIYDYSEWLRRDINILLLAVEKEILDTKHVIKKYKEKKSERQLTIFDIWQWLALMVCLEKVKL